VSLEQQNGWTNCFILFYKLTKPWYFCNMHSFCSWFLHMSRSYTVQYTTKSFQLSRANREMLQKAEYDIQVNSISFFFISIKLLSLLRIIMELPVYWISTLSFINSDYVQAVCVQFFLLEFGSIFLCRFGVFFWMTKSLLGCSGLYTLICKLMVYGLLSIASHIFW
jgi:Sec-independent protein secretion pathway component TatC